MNSLLSRSRYGATMPLYQPGGYGANRRTWSLDPPPRGAAAARPPAKRPAERPAVRDNFPEEPRRGPNTRGNARAGATNTRSSTGVSAEPVKVAIPCLENLLKLSGNKEAIIGLKYIVETAFEENGATQSYSYKCTLCGKDKCTPPAILQHVISNDHRRNYIKELKLEAVEDRDLAKRAGAIEAVHGRGKWETVTDCKGLKKFDKSAFFVKRKKGGNAAGGDVEMVDVEKGNKDPQLRDGDVVIDELTAAQVAEEAIDPKNFVLNCFDQLLSKDFKVESDEEATLVDSIIQKLDAALFGYSKIQPKVDNEEENKNGNSENNESVESGAVKNEAVMEA